MANPSSQTSFLFVHEWMIVILFCLLLCILAILAYSRQPSSFTSSKSYQQLQITPLLKIKIEGAVAKPALYQLPKGSLLIEAITLAEPLAAADLSFLKANDRLEQNQTVIVPEKKWITIYVQGAVEGPGLLEVLEGTSYEDLLDLLSFLPDADYRALKKKKKRLREGETVQISFKQTAIKKAKNLNESSNKKSAKNKIS